MSQSDITNLSQFIAAQNALYISKGQLATARSVIVSSVGQVRFQCWSAAKQNVDIARQHVWARGRSPEAWYSMYHNKMQNHIDTHINWEASKLGSHW